MDKLKRTIVKSLLLVLAATVIVIVGTMPVSGEKDMTIHEYVNNMQPGWNVGNTLDAVGGETNWGNPMITEELIQQIAAQGFKSIRIPITWEHELGEGPDYEINPTYLARVEEVVNWALEADLFVMINLHHDSWLWVNEMDEPNDLVHQRYDAIWRQIADHFKDHSIKLMFESINEPRFGDGWGVAEGDHEKVDALNRSFFHIVRESGGNNDTRPLVLPTIETASDQEDLDELKRTIDDLNDPNLIATVHYYGFWPFSVNVAGHTTFDQETRDHIHDTFDRVHETFVDNGIPVIVGEFGLLGFDRHTGVIQQGEKLKFFEYLIHYFNEKEITHMLWDNGQHFNRHTFEWQDHELYQMMKESWAGRSAVAESNLIFLNAEESIRDQEMLLQLNGNTFESLSFNGQELQKGEDYQLQGEVLTLKANLLERITDLDVLGFQAHLTASFNQGANWRFDVISYKRPEMSDVEGGVSDFGIPTALMEIS